MKLLDQMLNSQNLFFGNTNFFFCELQFIFFALFKWDVVFGLLILNYLLFNINDTGVTNALRSEQPYSQTEFTSHLEVRSREGSREVIIFLWEGRIVCLTLLLEDIQENIHFLG